MDTSIWTSFVEWLRGFGAQAGQQAADAGVQLGGVVGAQVVESLQFNGRDVSHVAPLAQLDCEWAHSQFVRIGNPHCVLPMDEVTPELARRLGPLIENDVARFPNRTNVQFLQVLDRNNIRIEIWERGAGYTLASGSSSSASAKMRCCASSTARAWPPSSRR